MGTARVSRGKIRILVADREGVFRLGLKKLFAVEDDLRVVAEADKAADVLARMESFRPDLAFIQEEILAESNGSLISAVAEAAPNCRVVATASSESDESSTNHIRSGAAGVILKSVDPQMFVKCARRVYEGDTWIPKKQVSAMAKILEARSDTRPRPVDTLTRREKSVICCLMEGWHNREISTHLSISEQTVKNHLRAIYDKVGVSDRLELVLYAIHQRLELPAMQANAPLQ
ncbi:MAG: response regulator transcription factor [Terriglobia bacterium]|jgi:DNA-binding NarL/FixJ family response regulator